CQALVVPREVSGQEGETLSLRCWYARGYEGYNKYWCRGAARGSCHKVVETAGREVPRRHGRVSITDNHIFCVVLLTVEELSVEDAGSYWCGVERAGRDIMEPVTVTVRPGLQKENTSLQKGQEQPPSSPPSLSGPALQVLLPTVVLLFLLAMAGSAGLIYARRTRRRRRRKEGVWAVSGPSQVTARWGSSLSVSCSYQPGYKLHSKVWCKSYFFKIFCTYMAQTDGSEAAVTQGRVSIRDNHTALAFTVTMRDVMAADAGWYSCGAVKSLWNNQWHKTEVLVSEGACDPGPAVRGRVAEEAAQELRPVG
ncbi:hypothetical protein CIB84_011946, partial [Bambusicola thoracicus]